MMVYLRPPALSDKAIIQELYARSDYLHHPWSYAPKDYNAYLVEDGRYFLCLKLTNDIVGTFNISGVMRGYFQSAYLSYEVFAPHERHGFMREGLQLLINEAFIRHNLHRLEANIQPENTASIRLVAGAGFVQEGLAKNYLNIGGKGWKDHERWSLVNADWQYQAKFH